MQMTEYLDFWCADAPHAVMCDETLKKKNCEHIAICIYKWIQNSLFSN